MSLPVVRLRSSTRQCLQSLNQPFPSSHIARRQSSRYSNPSPRTVDAAPSQRPSFASVAQPIGPVSAIGHGFNSAEAQRIAAEARAYHVRRMRYAGVGLLLSVAGLAAVLYNVDLEGLEQKTKKQAVQLDAPSESAASFQGRAVHVIGAGEDKRIVAEGNEETGLVETGTSHVPYFPRTMFLPSSPDATISPIVGGATPNTSSNPGNVRNEEEYTFLGLGIRTVFYIQVYVLGLYVRTADLAALQSQLIHHINADASTLIPSEKEELRKHLLDPSKSTEIWDKVLRTTDIKSAWRIVPTRNTDFGHLRDGWITAIKRGSSEAAAAAKANAAGPVESEYESEEFGNSVRNFKDLFTGGGRAPKGSVVVLLRDGAGSLEILFQQQEKTEGLEKLGKVEDPRIGRLVWMGYLAGQKVSSEAARQGVVDGCIGIAARPVGSVETMVK